MNTIASVEREYNFSGSDFERVRRMIHVRAGISLNTTKQNMVYSRLSRRLRSLQIDSFTDYLDALEANHDTSEWENFVNALTTNLTAFFREEHHFPVLHEQIVQAGREPFSIWCSAASTGEEPYSLAMTALEARASGAAPVQILATDIDTNVLAKAQTGVYREDLMKNVSQERCRKFFQRGTRDNEGMFRIKSAVADLIKFRQLNLLTSQWPVSGPFDAIFCRNVLIYFEKSDQRKVVERMANLLKPGGLLFVGHSENFTDFRHILELRGKTVYQRVSEAAANKKASV